MSNRKSTTAKQQVLVDPKVEFETPPMFTVYLMNDDFTPIHFVVDVLQRYFGMGSEVATQVVLEIRQSGKGICGLYTRDIAETKVLQVNEYAKRNQHPLLCSMEEV